MIVIGAGISGLVVGHELGKLGYEGAVAAAWQALKSLHQRAMQAAPA